MIATKMGAVESGPTAKKLTDDTETEGGGLLGDLIDALPSILMDTIGLSAMVYAAIPVSLLAMATYFADQADINDPGLNPFGQTASLGLKFGNWFDKVTGRSEKLKAEQQKRNEERMTKGDPWENKNAPADAEQLKKLAPVIQHYEKLYNEATKPEEKKQIETALNSVYDQRDALIKKIGGVDAPGERITGKKSASPAKPVENKAEAPAQKTETPQPKAEPVAAPNPQTQKLSAAITENNDAQLPKEKAQDNLVVNNTVKSTKSKQREPDKLSELGVRNDEPTIRRMLMNSTKFV